MVSKLKQSFFFLNKNKTDSFLKIFIDFEFLWHSARISLNILGKSKKWWVGIFCDSAIPKDFLNKNKIQSCVFLKY